MNLLGKLQKKVLILLQLQKLGANLAFSGRDDISEYKIDGYELFVYDRKYNEGGGVMIYAKSDLQPTEVKKTINQRVRTCRISVG